MKCESGTPKARPDPTLEKLESQLLPGGFIGEELQDSPFMHLLTRRDLTGTPSLSLSLSLPLSLFFSLSLASGRGNVQLKRRHEGQCRPAEGHR